jgi:PAP_fibrillin
VIVDVLVTATLVTGWLDVLYADGELRITRGNKKSLVIVERM